MSDPEALVDFFGQLEVKINRIGLQAGPFAAMAPRGTAGLGFVTELLETRQ
jgi:hypothetical protein